MPEKQTIKKNPGLIAHTHCPSCGEHFRAVGKLIDRGNKNWICGRCDARAHVQAGNLVVVKCPECQPQPRGDDMKPCGACHGYGSVRVPEGVLPLYDPTAPKQSEQEPKQEVLVEG